MSICIHGAPMMCRRTLYRGAESWCSLERGVPHPHAHTVLELHVEEIYWGAGCQYVYMWWHEWGDQWVKWHEWAKGTIFQSHRTVVHTT